MSTDNVPPPQAIFPSPKTKASRFARIDNALLQDPRLSFRAIGIAAFLLSKPKTWRFSSDTLARKGNRGEGAKALASAVKELIRFGYVERLKERDASGHFRDRLILNETPTTQKGQPVPTDQKGGPVTDNPFTDPRSTGTRLTDPRSTDRRKQGGVINDRLQTTDQKRLENKRPEEAEAAAARYVRVTLIETELIKLARKFETSTEGIKRGLGFFNAKKKRHFAEEGDQTVDDFDLWLSTDAEGMQSFQAEPGEMELSSDDDFTPQPPDEGTPSAQPPAPHGEDEDAPF